MNATKRSAARAGWVLCGALAVAATGCRTHVVHTRTVYVPAPPPVVQVTPAPAPEPLPPVVVVPPPEQPPAVVIQAVSEFYQPLAPYGRWVVVGSYGRCWIPAHVEVGWRPYANGYWQRTDAGWYWVSEEPWGWATYHYGRWDFHAEFGWIWVPHTQWAPAWVSWREGGGYVGWAPLRPSFALNVSVGTAVREPAFESRAFVFVERRRMLEPVRPHTVIVNNTTIINKTVNITNVKVVNKTVINEGPHPEVIERESGKKVRVVPAHEFRRREEAAVAARQRNLATAAEKSVQPPARLETQPAPRETVLRRNAPVVEKPAAVGKPVVAEKPGAVVTPPARPLATPARPAPPPAEAGKPARGVNRREAETGKRIKATPPTAAPRAKPEVQSLQAVPPRRDLRPVEKPAAATKPAPPPVMTNPTPAEKQRETTIGKKKTATTPAAAPRPGYDPRPETRPESKTPAKVETAPPPAIKKQPAPPAEKPGDKRVTAPGEKSRAAEKAEPNKKKKDEKGPKKKGEDSETPAAAPTRPAQ
jgi:hypothetical protein